MKIILEQIGKKFSNEWVFKNISVELFTGKPCAILGRNGSGKSTLSQIIAGYTVPSEGKVSFFFNDKIIPNDTIFKHVTVCSPHLELIEEFTLAENIRFFSKFKSFMNGYSLKDIPEIAGLSGNLDKQLRYFSSGMKQRIKLVFALCCQAEAIILDEPCTNLDESGIALYRRLITDRIKNSIIVVASNHSSPEYDFCSEYINLCEYSNAE